MDPGIRNLLRAAEIRSGPDLHEVERPSVLVQNPQIWDDTRMFAEIVEAPLPLLANFDNTVKWNGIQGTGRMAYFTYVPDLKETILASQVLLLKLYQGQPPIEGMDTRGLHLKTMEDSLCIPWYQTTTQPLTHIDWFCGGFGGWSFAMKHLIKANWPQHRTIGIDNDVAMAAQHSINHDTILVPDQALPAQWFNTHTQDATLQGDLFFLKSIQSLAVTCSQLWTASFPCQPWSSSASARGFHDGNGLAFVQLLALARQMRPRIIGLENVRNFRMHDHYPTAVKIIQWAGYRILFDTIMNAQDHLPTNRARWVAVLQRVEDPVDDFQWSTWGQPTKANPLLWDVWVPSTEEELLTFTPPREVLQMYMNPNLTPKSAPYFAKENMIRYRMPSMQHKTPTVMALYGSQHRLPEDLIAAKGLHGFFTAEKSIPRFWKPHELALIHLQVDTLTLLKPVQLSWKSIGNCIVLHHASTVLVNGLKQLFDTPDGFNLSDFLTDLVVHRIRASQSNVIHDEFGWTIARTYDDALTQHMCIQNMSKTMGWHETDQPTWPDATYYDPAKGLCDVHTGVAHILHSTGVEFSATLPYRHDIDPEEPSERDIDSAPGSPCHSEDASDRFFRAPAMMDVACDAMNTDSDHSMDDTFDPHSPPASTMLDQPTTNPMDEDWVDITVHLIPGNYGVIRAAKTLKYENLLALWYDRLFPVTLLKSPITTEEVATTYVDHTMLCPVRYAKGTLGHDPQDIVCDMDFHRTHTTKLYLMDTNLGCCCIDATSLTWSQVTLKYPELPEHGYNEWGSLSDGAQFTHSCRIFAEPFSVFLQSEPDVELLFQVPPDTDIWVVHFTGAQQDILLLASVWHQALTVEWQDHHGRQVCMQIDDDTHLRIVIRPDGRHTSTPVALLTHAIAARLIQTLALATHQSDTQPNLVIKDFVSTVAAFDTTTMPNLHPVFTCLRHAYSYWSHGLAPRLVCRGKQIIQETDPQELFAVAGNPVSMVAHLVMPLKGGTGGSKSDHKRTVHSMLASLLVEHGIPLEQVPDHVQNLQIAFGFPKISHILFTADPEDKLRQFRELCKHTNIPLQTQQTNTDQVKNKFQKLANRKNTNKSGDQLDPRQYTLVTGFFKTRGGQAVPINATFSPCKPGVTMMSQHEAEHWTTMKHKLLPDECAIFLLGQPPADCPAKRIVAPALNHNNQTCLISGFLLQLGEKEVVFTDDVEDPIQCHDIQVCSFTVWSSDWTEEQWKAFQEAPVKQTKKVLEADGVQAGLQMPFGRTYHNNQSCEVSFARMIWIDAPAKKIETIALTHPGTAGLCKGRRTLGVRCENRHFEEVWRLFHGDLAPQQKPPDGDLYKAQNLPYGVDRQVLEEWLAKMEWQAYPLKSIGSRAWILKSATPPSSEVLTFNTEPVLIRRLAQKPVASSGLIVGPRSKPAPMKPNAGPDHRASAYRTGDPYYDPWKTNTTLPGPLTAMPAASSAPSTAAPVQGPTMAMLNKHDEQIAALESALQQVQDTQRTTTSKVEDRIARVETVVTQQSEATKQWFSDFRKEFNDSFQTAARQQDQKMQSTLDELKSLFQRAESRSDKRKTPEIPSDEDDM
eukprot:Skav228574  [mRNA]  locus=scaffold1368:104524:109418:- [translate_table: standard]